MVEVPPRAAADAPNLLVVGPSPFNRHSSGGVTLSVLFEGWPRDRLAQIYTEPVEPSTEVCERFYWLRPNRRFRGPLLWRQVRQHWEVVRGRSDGALLLGGISSALDAWVRASPPDIVLCHLASVTQAQLAMRIAERYGARLAVYVPDDWMPGWPSNVLGSSRPVLDSTARFVLERTVRSLMSRASLHFGISEAMREEYLQRYGADFEPVYNSVDLAAWPPRGPQRDLAHEPMRIVYSGSLFHYGGAAALADVRDAVERLNREGAPGRLEVYSRHADVPEMRERFERPPYSSLHALVPADRLADNLQSADLLVLPVNFDAASERFLRLSMPGKLAEYLASGTPVLAYGPGGTAQERLLRAEGAAEIVDRPDVDALVAALRSLRDDPARRAELGATGRAAAERHFDASAVRARFQAMLRGEPVAVVS
jgi:glycosyltransferase involved in cell wall biosynthesis